MAYSQDWPIEKHVTYPNGVICTARRQPKSRDLYVVNGGPPQNKFRAIYNSGCYWKIHLGVATADDPLTTQIVDFLCGHLLVGEFKVGAGSEDIKKTGMTIYIGTYDDMVKVSTELDKKFSAQLPHEIEKADLRVIGNISARFTPGKGDKIKLVQCGFTGVTVSEQMMSADLWDKNKKDPDVRKTQLSKEFLQRLNDYGPTLIGAKAYEAYCAGGTKTDALPMWAQHWIAADFAYLTDKGLKPDIDKESAPTPKQWWSHSASKAQTPAQNEGLSSAFSTSQSRQPWRLPNLRKTTNKPDTRHKNN